MFSVEDMDLNMAIKSSTHEIWHFRYEKDALEIDASVIKWANCDCFYAVHIAQLEKHW